MYTVCDCERDLTIRECLHLVLLQYMLLAMCIFMSITHSFVFKALTQFS